MGREGVLRIGVRVGVVEARAPDLLRRREGPRRALGAMELGAHSIRGRHGAWQGEEPWELPLSKRAHRT